ncbi:MAG: cation transporter [Methanosarcinaceae archaeon]|nr:cation transporter [Methanosarcinaceae archaeon]
MDNRFRKIRVILFRILLLNFGVALVKIGYGMLTGTLSMEADGYHSLLDGVSNIVGLIGIQIASKTADKEHPYGHRKYETLASIAIAFLLLYVGFEIVYSAIGRFSTGMQPVVTSISFAVMILTMVVNLFVTTYENKQGILLESEILVADSMHTKSDIYVSLSVLLGLFAIKIGYPIVDPIIALIIAAVVVRAGYLIICQSTYTLCDMSRLDEEAICNLVNSIEGVQQCHNIRTRGVADDIHVDLHVKVSPNMHTDKAHALSHTIEEHLKKNFVGITDVIVHVEPAET